MERVCPAKWLESVPTAKPTRMEIMNNALRSSATRLMNYSFVVALCILVVFVVSIPILKALNSSNPMLMNVATAASAPQMQRLAKVVESPQIKPTAESATVSPSVVEMTPMDTIVPTPTVTTDKKSRPLPKYRPYTVRPGDRLSTLDSGWADTCRINRQLGKNGIRDDCKLIAGADIVLPTAIVEQIATTQKRYEEHLRIALAGNPQQHTTTARMCTISNSTTERCPDDCISVANTCQVLVTYMVVPMIS